MALEVESDISNTLVLYNSTPMDHKIRIEVNFQLSGVFLREKTYSHFFKPISWQNDSTPIKFKLESLPTIQIEQPTVNTTIFIMLRTDIIYDISIASTIGNINVLMPPNSIINSLNMSTNVGNISLLSEGATFYNSLAVNSSTGRICLQFIHGILGKKIFCSTYASDIALKSYNNKCNNNCRWELFSQTGSILMNVFQDVELGATILGEAKSSVGTIALNYEDTLKTVGAQITGRTSTGAISFTSYGGFSNTLSLRDGLKVYSSFDYLKTKHNYNLLLDSDSGPIIVNAKSVY